MSSISLKVYITPFAEKGVEGGDEMEPRRSQRGPECGQCDLVKGEYCVCDQ